LDREARDGTLRRVLHHIIGGKEDLLNTFPSSEQGEIDAKTFALAACQKH